VLASYEVTENGTNEDEDEHEHECIAAPPSALRGLTSRIYSGAQVILGGGDEGP
jgi:hypothetical protein